MKLPSAPAEKAWLTLAFVLHIGITLWVSLHHEAWHDEADTWLLVRDATPADMLQAASNAGVPMLWHLTILPFARAGFSYVALQMLNLVYVWGAVFLILRSRAFSTPVKVLFALSYYPAFEFGVIPRPYGLQMLLTFAVAEAWRTRHERPMRLGVLVALLANTTALGLVTAAIAGALLLAERVSWRGLVIMVAGGLASAAQLWPREGRHMSPFVPRLETLWFSIGSMFFPDWRVEDAIGPGLIVLGTIFYGISRHWKPPFFLATVLAAILQIYIFIWMGGLRHAGVLLLIALAAVIIADAYGPYRRERLLMAALAVAFAFSIPTAVRSWMDETRYAFCGSREAGTFVRESGLDRNGTTLVAASPFTLSFLVYAPRAKLWHPFREEHGTYLLWTRRELIPRKVPDVVELARTQMGSRPWVLVTSQELPENLRDRFRLLHRTRQPIWKRQAEAYFFYEPLRRP